MELTTSSCPTEWLFLRQQSGEFVSIAKGKNILSSTSGPDSGRYTPWHHSQTTKNEVLFTTGRPSPVLGL